MKSAQAVLDARQQFPDSTLADPYDPVSMPPALAKAHAVLDLAVDRCYRNEPFGSGGVRLFYPGGHGEAARNHAVASGRQQ